jgi:CheY-like chemotaxis protein
VADQNKAGRKHVFAIDGSVAFLNIVRELFQEEGYAVTTTNFTPDSFAQIGALQPDALIIDVAVGQQVGWDLLEQLRADAQTAGIPALLVSTAPWLLAQAQERAQQFGTHRYLEKPGEIGALLTQIRAMIGEA